ncbi:putative short-chain dehydrogenase [Hyaloraphidium curvatum]|nr:putative short-chain dehydrogenase [Hyaloraphidium curvatum]
MKSFADKLAVISGGGSGMGKELAVQLAREGCAVAFCDVRPESLDGTIKACKEANPNVKVTGHVVDVTKEADWLRFKDEVLTQHDAKVVHLLVCQAGIGGATSMFTTPREEWESVFDVSWKGVYFGNRTFLPLLKAAPEAHVVNTSSAAAIWSTGTSYSAAKGAIRHFTEALVMDCRANAPHIGVSVVMPGHIATGIRRNSPKVTGYQGPGNGEDASKKFEETAPMTAAQAANVILDAVREKRWRVLVGEDAKVLDAMVRESPEEVYERTFFRKVKKRNILQGPPGYGPASKI